MSDEPEYLTQGKFDELKRELDALKTMRRKEVAENLEYAKSLGDLSENAEYHEAREMQANVEDRIGKLEAMLSSAVIVKMHHTEAVAVGSTVRLKKEGGKDEVAYKIVGSEEADLAQGKLSIHSPLGASMLGKRKGDNFSVKTPSGVQNYKLINLE